MKKTDIEMTNIAKQTLTTFEVENSIRRHCQQKAQITSYYSTRGGMFHVVTEESNDSKTILIMLASEGELMNGS